MQSRSKLSLILGAGLGLSVLATHVSAQSCEGNEPCGEGPLPGIEERAPEALEGVFSNRKRMRQERRERRRQRRQREIYSEPQEEDDVYIEGQPGRGDLIGPTEALTQALAAVPGGKALGVKLLKGPNPVYAVRLRVRGRVRQILVDARTAAILGE
jgi:uncharacterized membrane protein YkoI